MLADGVMNKGICGYIDTYESGVSEILEVCKLAINYEARSEIWVVTINVNDEL